MARIAPLTRQAELQFSGVSRHESSDIIGGNVRKLECLDAASPAWIFVATSPPLATHYCSPVLHSNRNGRYNGTKAHPRPMDGVVANGTRGLDQRFAVHWFSGSSGSMDQPPAFGDGLCRCSLRSVACVWAIDGLQRKAFEHRGSGVFPVVPGWSHRVLLDRTAHPSGVRSCSPGRAAGT